MVCLFRFKVKDEYLHYSVSVQIKQLKFDNNLTLYDNCDYKAYRIFFKCIFI